MIQIGKKIHLPFNKSESMDTNKNIAKIINLQKVSVECVKPKTSEKKNKQVW